MKIAYIKIYKDEANYEEFKTLQNAQIMNEDEEDEYVVFYTIPAPRTKCE